MGHMCSTVPIFSLHSTTVFSYVIMLRSLRAETEKRERLRRARMAAEAKVAVKEAREEKARAARIAAMRAFTVDLQVLGYTIQCMYC